MEPRVPAVVSGPSPADPREALRSAHVGLGSGARADLLRLLTPPHVRADVIRQFYERRGKQGRAELLIDLEEDEIARATVIEILGDSGNQERPLRVNTCSPMMASGRRVSS